MKNYLPIESLSFILYQLVLVCQSSWLLLVAVWQIYEFKISFHAKMVIPDILNLWCQIKDISLICWILSEIFFYVMPFCFESPHYDIPFEMQSGEQ